MFSRLAAACLHLQLLGQDAARCAATLRELPHVGQMIRAFTALWRSPLTLATVSDVKIVAEFFLLGAKVALVVRIGWNFDG